MQMPRSFLVAISWLGFLVGAVSLIWASEMEIRTRSAMRVAQHSQSVAQLAQGHQVKCENEMRRLR